MREAIRPGDETASPRVDRFQRESPGYGKREVFINLAVKFYQYPRHSLTIRDGWLQLR
jgi:hypothetical protein